MYLYYLLGYKLMGKHYADWEKNADTPGLKEALVVRCGLKFLEISPKGTQIISK